MVNIKKILGRVNELTAVFV